MKLTKNFPFINVLIIVMSGPELWAQAYQPMPVSDARWDVTRCWAFYPGGWHDEYSIRMDGSDTTINGKVYKKLDLFTHHLPGTQFDSVYVNFLGGMREANKQVFFLSEYLCLDTMERMLYDFNDAAAGDTIFTQILTHDLTQFLPHIVTSIDSVLVGNEYHRRIHLRDEHDFFTESWTEGVGSSWGLVYASYWQLTDNSYDLNCFYDQNVLEFSNQQPSYAFCTSPLPDIVCDPVSAVPSPFPAVAEISVFPNPAFDVLHIESGAPFHTLHIFNSCGQRALASGYCDQVDVLSLPAGLYFIQFIGNDGQVILNVRWVKI